jgi:hypothetical protein
VTDYLNSLKSQGVTYAYAWWADARYAAAAWVGGSFLLIGIVWPTCVNLLAFGTLRRPRESRGVSLWRVKASAATRVPQPLAPPAPSPAHAGPVRSVAPAPFQSTGDRQTGRLPAAGATVTDYLNSLKSQGVTYAYAWWADPRYAAAAWVGGSFLLIGVVWPTCVNLLAFGTLRRPREEKAESLWRVKASTPARAKQPIAATVPSPARNIPHRPVATGNPAPPQPMTVSPAPALVLEPVPAWPAADDPHKEFGAGRDDFYPTELKAPHPAETHGGKH